MKDYFNNILTVVKAFFNNIQTIVIVVLVTLLLIQRSCYSPHPCPPSTPQVVTHTVVEYDTLKVDTVIYKPKWRDRIIHDTIPANVDTLSILKDYFTKYFYSDTLKVDTLGYIAINDTITRNSIYSRNIKSKLIIPHTTTTITNTEYINKNEFYWGFGMAGNMNQISYIGGELFWKNKKQQAYGLGVGIDQNLKPVISGHMYWKIGK